MQKINLELNHFNFYCPVTGKQVLKPDEPFEPSPAMLFCFLQDENCFEFAQDFIQEAYNKYEMENNGKSYDQHINAFEKLTDEFLGENDNYVLFTIATSGMTCNGGISWFVQEFAFDMNYSKPGKDI